MQKYYPKNKLDKNSLLYGGLKNIANEYYFNISYDKIGTIEIIQPIILFSQGSKDSLDLLNISSISFVDLIGIVGFNGKNQVVTTSSLITNGSKNALNNLIISSIQNIEVIGISEIPIYDFLGNVSISSNQSIQVQGLKQIVRHTNIYQLSLAYLYGIKNGYDSTLIDQSSSIEVIKGSLSIIVKIISSKVKLDSINNSTSIFESYTSIKTIGSSVNRTVRFGNEYNNKTRRNN